MPAGSVTVTYVLPLSGDGKVELHINAPLDLEDKDREFILSVMKSVGEFAELASPGAKKPETHPPGGVYLDAGEPVRHSCEHQASNFTPCGTCGK
jgi:hypothetical protein